MGDGRTEQYDRAWRVGGEGRVQMGEGLAPISQLGMVQGGAADQVRLAGTVAHLLVQQGEGAPIGVSGILRASGDLPVGIGKIGPDKIIVHHAAGFERVLIGIGRFIVAAFKKQGRGQIVVQGRVRADGQAVLKGLDSLHRFVLGI